MQRRSERMGDWLADMCRDIDGDMAVMSGQQRSGTICGTSRASLATIEACADR